MARAQTLGKQTAIIPTGAAGVSNAINLGGERIVALFTPAAWVAAVLEFEASFDGGLTWFAVIDDAAAAVSIASATIATAKTIVASTILNKLNGLTMIRLASGAAGARVDQTAARTFGIVTKTI